MKSIRQKLILIFIPLLIISMVVSQLFMMNRVTSSLKESINKTGKDAVQNIVEEMDARIALYLPGAGYFAKDPDIVKQIKDGEEKMPATIKERVARYAETNDGISSVYIGLANQKLPWETGNSQYDNDYDARDRFWYKQALEDTSKAHLSEPEEDAITKELKTTISQAILDGNKVIGVVAMDIPLDFMRGIIEGADLDYNGDAMLIASDGLILVHDRFEGQNINEIERMHGLTEGESGDFLYVGQDGTDRYVYYDSVNGLKIATFYFEKELFATVSSMQNFAIILTTIATIIGAFIIFMVASRITKPLIVLNQQVQHVAEGDLTVQATINSKDEIGQLGGHFNTMVERIRALLQDIQNSATSVSDASNNLSAVSEETMATSSQITHAIQEVAEGASEQSVNLEQMQNVTSDLTEQFDHLLTSMSMMNELSVGTNEAGDTGIKALNVLNIRSTEMHNEILTIEEVIKQLVQDIQGIQQIVGAINDISGQTNLLALNASIEAARAGEAGKGFAVVATEVRKLAEQSAVSAEQIAGVIDNIVLQVENAQTNMQQTLAMTEQQNASVADTQEAFENIQGNAEELLQAITGLQGEVSQMTTSKDRVVESIESLSAISEQSAAAAQEVSASSHDQLSALSTVAHSAEDLSQLSRSLETQINQFKTE